ncbi:MAG TPA: HemK2/MTQ2 family protein methyltransferase [Thermoplasmata archaeon]|nr:HemK2/MTQ2 family protein methyltransferase [Thermoplasmata archaeon]
MRADPEVVVEDRPNVYRPSDDSYLLLGAVSVSPGDRFLEVGAGAGLLALHAAGIAKAVATDVIPEAVELLRMNARRNRVALEVVRTDLMAGLRGPFDVVAFNPPYLAGEPTDAPERAWQGGEAGSEVAIRFLRDLPRILAVDGRAYLLLSRENAPARELAESSFRVKVKTSKDLFFERLEVLELRQGLE